MHRGQLNAEWPATRDAQAESVRAALQATEDTFARDHLADASGVLEACRQSTVPEIPAARENVTVRRGQSCRPHPRGPSLGRVRRGGQAETGAGFRGSAGGGGSSGRAGGVK